MAQTEQPGPGGPNTSSPEQPADAQSSATAADGVDVQAEGQTPLEPTEGAGQAQAPATSDAPSGADTPVAADSAAPDAPPAEAGELAPDAVGTVVDVQGGACEIAGDGAVNMLNEGDRVNLFESLQTMEDGLLIVEFDSGGMLQMGAGRYAFVDSEVAENVNIADLVGESSCRPDEVERYEDITGQPRDDGDPLTPPPGLEDLEPGAIGQALAQGVDPGDLLEATAAGSGAPGAGAPGTAAPGSLLSEGSSSLIQLERTEQATPGLPVRAAGPELGTAYESPLIGGEGDGLLAGDLIDLGGGPVQEPVELVEDNVATAQGQTLTVDPTANDSLSEGAALTDVSQPPNGTVAINPDGTVSYTPNSGFSGEDAFTYTVTLSDGSTRTATVNVDVAPDANVEAVDDVASTSEDTPISIDVMANDSFPAGAFVTGVTQPANGTVSIDADGLLNFTPSEDFSGTETFTYTVTTSDGSTETATVTVVVNPTADAADDTATVPEDSSVNINVLANDTFGPGAAVVGVGGASNGVVAVGADGSITYTPAPDFVGTETFTYNVRTAAGDIESATVSVTVTPANDVPDAVNDAPQVVAEDGVLANIDVLSNDSDPDGDPLSVTGVSASNGTVTVNPDGTLNYTPRSGLQRPRYDHLHDLGWARRHRYRDCSDHGERRQ